MTNQQTLMLEHYSKLIQMFKQQFGELCHAVLYSLHRTGDKYWGNVISSAGFLSSIKIDDPLPNFLLEHIKANGVADKYSFLNKDYPDKQLRSSIMFISDRPSAAFACLCIHNDLGNMAEIIDNLEGSVEVFKSICCDKNNMYMLKTFKAADVGEFVQNVINDYFRAYARDGDITLLDVDTKLELVAALQEKGVFEVGGSIDLVASRLDISKFRLFSHIDSHRGENVRSRA